MTMFWKSLQTKYWLPCCCIRDSLSWPCSEKVEVWPRVWACMQNICDHVAELVIPFNLTMFWKSWILTVRPHLQVGVEGLQAKYLPPCCCFVCLFNSLGSINNLSVIKRRVFLGWTSTKLGLMFLLRDTKSSDASEAWTRGPSVSSQALYYCATHVAAFVITFNSICNMSLNMTMFWKSKILTPRVMGYPHW